MSVVSLVDADHAAMTKSPFDTSETFSFERPSMLSVAMPLGAAELPAGPFPHATSVQARAAARTLEAIGDAPHDRPLRERVEEEVLPVEKVIDAQRRRPRLVRLVRDLRVGDEPA